MEENWIYIVGRDCKWSVYSWKIEEKIDQYYYDVKNWKLSKSWCIIVSISIIYSSNRFNISNE